MPDGIRASDIARTGNDLEKSLHSRYDPHAEAVRFIDSLQLKNSIECFILIEPGFGFLIPVLKERFPDSKIIILHAEKNLSKDKITSGCAVYYNSSSGILSNSQTSEIKKFLESNVPETDVSKIKIIEWRPSMNYFKESYLILITQVVEFLKRLDAGKRTLAVFGKRWFKNFFRNIDNVKNTVFYNKTCLPVIVTGSSPNLEQVLPLIASIQDYCLIISASSSVMALSRACIKPDLIIATDGGNWARKHLQSAVSDTANKKLNDSLKQSARLNKYAFAVNLCAALPSQLFCDPFLIINDGSFWQSVILHELSLPSVIIGQRGTVSATAAELAMLLSDGNIYLAGMDFANNDIRTHVKPYAFDGIFSGYANRFIPVYSTAFKRSSLLKEGGSFNIYETWFKDQLSSWRKIYSLTDHKIFTKATPENLSVKKNINDIIGVTANNENSAQFRKKSADILLSAIDNPNFSDNIKNELSSLLFPSNSNNVTKEELKNKILEVIRN